MSTGEEAKEYAAEKGQELATILAGVSCEFATTATMTVREAPKISFKEGNAPNFTTLMLASNSAVIDDYVGEALKKQIKEKEKFELERRPWMYKEKPESLIRRDGALLEQLDRLASLQEAMPQASFGHGSKVSAI